MVASRDPSESFQVLKDYVGFTEADTRRLRELLPLIEPHLETICDTFYTAIWANPATAKVLANPERIVGLRRSLKLWMAEILTGPHDGDFYRRHLAIGERHVQVGLAQQYMFTAMNLLRRDLSAIARERLPSAELGPTLDSLHRILDMELAIMLHTYTRRRTDQALEDLRDLLMTHLPITAILLDGDGRISTVTGSYQSWVFSPEASLQTRPPMEMAIAPALLAAANLRERVAQAAASGNDLVLPRLDVTLGGRARSLRLTVVPLDHAQAKTLLHIEDLSEIIAFEQRARQAESLAQLGQMSAAIAHELRNPLAGFSGTIQVIRASLPPEDRRHQIMGKVLEQIGRLDQLVTDLLQFARPVVASCEEVDLHHLGQRIASQVALSQLGQTRVRGQGTAYADGGLLLQALQNLAQNAWQGGASRVEIRVAPGRLRVVDDGPGVPEDKRVEIFKPFITTRTRGTGLGLPNAQRCVEAMGGKLSFVDSPLGGAGFEIQLLEMG